MKKFKGLMYTTLLLICCINSSAIARDMTGRLGVGFINEFGISSAKDTIPSMSVKYGFTRDTSVLVSFGFDTHIPTSTTLGGKIFHTVFSESNLNFYTAFGLGYVKQNISGINILGLFGTEVFIPGVESLGLSFESGACASNVSGSMQLYTVGFIFLNAGVHFYF